jgi:hypothetical protein
MIAAVSAPSARHEGNAANCYTANCSGSLLAADVSAPCRFIEVHVFAELRDGEAVGELIQENFGLVLIVGFAGIPDASALRVIGIDGQAMLLGNAHFYVARDRALEVFVVVCHGRSVQGDRPIIGRQDAGGSQFCQRRLDFGANARLSANRH